MKYAGSAKKRYFADPPDLWERKLFFPPSLYEQERRCYNENERL